MLLLHTALVTTVYNGHIEYLSFDNRTEFPWKFYSSIIEAENRLKNSSNIAGISRFLLVLGPVNSALCINASSEVIRPVPSTSCFSTGSCDGGATLALWILVPPVLNWKATGNVTLIKYGKLEISYGLVNDMRNGTTKPIPSLMFSIEQNGERCLWVSMIFDSMITNAWTHIALAIGTTGSLTAYLNGQETYVKKASCQSYTSQGNYAFSSGALLFTCIDELVLWNRVLFSDDVEKIYNATVYGGECL